MAEVGICSVNYVIYKVLSKVVLGSNCPGSDLRNNIRKFRTVSSEKVDYSRL